MVYARVTLAIDQSRLVRLSNTSRCEEAHFFVLVVSSWAKSLEMDA